MPLQEVGPLPMEDDLSAPTPSKPQFAPLSASDQLKERLEFRRVSVPAHRMTPLKNSWLALYKPVTETLKLDMRMNLKSKKVRWGKDVCRNYAKLMHQAWPLSARAVIAKQNGNMPPECATKN